MPQSQDNKSDVKKASFWISQSFIIVATVAGVYLAAGQGLKQALTFDALKSDQNNYYLRKSLQNELADNVGYIREYVQKVQNRVQKPPLNLETFVWNSMTYSASALETPSDLLRDAQKFYHQSAYIMNWPHYNDSQRAKEMDALADHVEKNVLPRFESDTLKLREKLKSNQITV